MDHDGLFKKLLTVFFMEFVALFLPDVASYIDPDFFEFVDKETFGRHGRRRRRKSDIVVKVRFRDKKEAYFLIHVENESSIRKQAGLPKRMFQYYLRLTERYNVQVYPVVIFSYDKPTAPAVATYEEKFPDKTVLQFHYTVIQLNRVPWRQFIKQPNPVATALMTKMQIPPEERPKVKAECLRLLASLRLTPDKADLIYVFIEGYLKLSIAESEIYEREFAQFDPEVKNVATEIISNLRKEGRTEGRTEGRREGSHDGKAEMLTLLLRQRFSTLPDTLTEKLGKLSSDQLNELAVRSLEFHSLAEIEAWLYVA